MTGARVLIFVVLLTGAVAVTGTDPPSPARGASVQTTYASAADAATATLERRFYHGPGRWNMCVSADCGTAVRDWGADALAYALYFRWKLTAEPQAGPIAAELVDTAPTYDTCLLGSCTMWSDVPMWDAVAGARTYAMTGDPRALDKARHAFAVVDFSDAFALGACPQIVYQKPAGGNSRLKTLETDSNYIKAALLLYAATNVPAYLSKAQIKYAAVRRYYLDPAVPLYSVYVFDDGVSCRQLRRRFFASVNGNMIDNGLALAAQTGEGHYRREALATARAVTRYLGDASGIYADLQADNDVAEPLIEAMYDVATAEHQPFARRWLLDAAAAAHPAPSGGYGRFFDGPPPAGPISAWSSSGGLTLAIAAGALDPGGVPSPNGWAAGRYVADSIATAPATIAFTGRAIALIGTIGEVCCEAGHVRVLIDGSETFDQTGIWQNKSPSSHRLPNSVLLSWRWPRSGRHSITLEPGIDNAKEGNSFVHLAGYEIVP